MAKFVIVDDNSSLVEAFRLMFFCNEYGELIDFYTIKETSDYLKKYHKDIEILLLDISLDGQNSLKILDEYSDKIKIIMLSGTSDEDLIRYCYKAGCKAFIRKDLNNREILDIIDKVLNGEIDQVKYNNIEKDESLLSNEQKVMKGVLYDLTNIEIGKIYHISESTVKKTLSGLYNKFGLTYDSSDPKKIREEALREYFINYYNA